MTGRLIASPLLVLLCLGRLALAGTIAFKPVQTYPVGTNPRAVVVGDFNHDRKQDLAVLNYGDRATNNDGSVSILFGIGDGTFQPAKNVAIGKNCTGLVGGDFNGDGDDDLALLRPGDSAANDDGDVIIFLGYGDGTFQQGQVLMPGKNPSSSSGAIVAIDVNGDQRLDIVVANNGDNTFSVLFGNGDGTFQLPVAYPLTSSPSSISALDLAGNGQTALAIRQGLLVGIWLNNGDGTFRQAPGIRGIGLTAGDFNGDKKDDLVTQPFRLCLDCNPPPPPPSPQLWIGNGDGTFQSPINTGQPASAAADFDGDGKLDLVATNSANGSVQVLISEGNGDGTFQQASSFSTGGAATSLIAWVGDLTGGGAPSIALLNFDSSGQNENNVSVFANAGTDFSISASVLNPKLISAGQSATSTISLGLLNGFNDPVSLDCSVQPATAGGPTCSLSSSSVAFDASGKATATLTVSAGLTAASLGPSRLKVVWFPVAGFAFLGAGLGAGFSRKRRALALLIGAILFCGLSTQLACGGGGSGGSSGPTVTAYTVTVTGTAGASQHSTTVNLTVQ